MTQSYYMNKKGKQQTIINTKIIKMTQFEQANIWPTTIGASIASPRFPASWTATVSSWPRRRPSSSIWWLAPQRRTVAASPTTGIRGTCSSAHASTSTCRGSTWTRDCTARRTSGWSGCCRCAPVRRSASGEWPKRWRRWNWRWTRLRRCGWARGSGTLPAARRFRWPICWRPASWSRRVSIAEYEDLLRLVYLFNCVPCIHTELANYDVTVGRPNIKRWLETVRSETQPHYDDAHAILWKIVAIGQARQDKAKL